MVLQIASKSIRWAATASLVLLVSAALSPPSAEASCGDYVMVGGSHAAHRSDADRRESQSPAVPRCQGPMCSDNSVPPAAPAPKIEIPVEHWAISAGARWAVLPRYEVLSPDADVCPCDGFGLSILRPPR